MKAWEGLEGGKLHLLVFGPDYGETVMVREPSGSWIVVDSLARTVGRRRWIPAVETLRALRERWGCVVLTHPHQDHAGGIAELLGEAGAGPVGCARPIQLARDWTETDDAEAQLANGQQEDALAAIVVRWRTDPSTRWEMRTGDTKLVGAVAVQALHPPGVRLRQLTDKNRLATPVLVTWGDTRLLLGADLTAAGWNALPAGVVPITHDAYKVAHHASKGAFVHTAHAPRGPKLWITTPYSKAHKLPRFEDGEGVALILGVVEKLHLTGVPFALARRGEWERTDLAREQKKVKLAKEVVIEVTGASTQVQDHWVRATFDDAGQLVELKHGPAAVIVVRDVVPVRSPVRRRTRRRR